MKTAKAKPITEERNKLYNTFLEKFPLDSLSNMTLSEYTNSDKDSSFCYWLVEKLESLGGIGVRGYTQFGIYAYKGDPNPKITQSDSKYAWSLKLNKDNAEDAFKVVRDELVKIANFADNGYFSEIDKLDRIFTNTSIVWKIAFMYSHKKLININSRKALVWLASQLGLENADKCPTSSLHAFLLDKKGNKDIFDYGDELWSKWRKYQEKNNDTNTTSENHEKEEVKNVIYTNEDFLNDVFIEKEELICLKGLLDAKKNLILQGPPGVGKTYAARRLAWTILGAKDDDHIAFVQFHQNYSYEDFVMGYKPDGNNSFTLKSGTFYNFCKKAQEKHDEKFFFIIDEINRGNVSKIFGELLMLIEKDYRGENLTLAYQKEGESFTVPENIYIIGMMNTADRSLALIDYALRRRFCFYSMKPCFDRLLENSSNQGDTHFRQLISEVKELNKRINESLGPGFEIGHSYFCEDKNKRKDNWLELIVEYEIVPMLEEYWFDNLSRVSEWRQRLLATVGKVVNGKSNEDVSISEEC